MSIINDALKKTQSQLEKFSPARQNPEHKDVHPFFWSIAIIVFVGFLGCAVVLGFLYFRQSERKKQAAINNTANNSKDSQPALMQTERSKERTDNPQSIPPSQASITDNDSLILNGIITMDQEPFALINNQIYKEGEYIGQRRILSISVNEVEIYDNGRTIILRTDNR